MAARRRRALRQGALSAAAVLAATAGAVPARADRRHQPLIYVGELAVDQVYTDNIRSQAGPRRDEETYTNFAAVIGVEQGRFDLIPSGFGLLARGHVFARFPEFNYVEFLPYAVYSFGRTELLFDYAFTPTRLLFDREEDGAVGAFFVGNLFATELRHKFGKRKRLRASLRTELEWRDFQPPDNDRDSFTPTALGEVRYQIGSFLTPRFGFEYGKRAAQGENFDREEAEVEGGFDVRLWWGTVLRLRYAHAWRDYPVDEARDSQGGRNSNFRRDDEIDKYEARFFLPMRALPGLVTHLRYQYRDAASTRPDRDFTRNDVLIGFTYSLSGR